jgi:hypothetical protein
MNIGNNGLIHVVKYRIYLMVNGHDKILARKWDTLTNTLEGVRETNIS